MQENQNLELHLYTSKGQIDTTTNHPFYVVDKGWVAAGDLKAGDEVYNLDGTTAVVTGAELEKFDEAIKVYNLEVEDFHSYFVGEEPVLVHNYEKDTNNSTTDEAGGGNGTYEKADYHGKKNNSVKNKAPNKGQEALDNSVSIGPNTTRRVGISDGEIVVFDETTEGVFHGHVRTWDELSEPMKAALRKAGMVNKKGKIIN